MVSDRTRTEATLGEYEGSAAAADAAEADQSDADESGEEGDAAGSDVDPIIVANPNGGAEILGPNDTPEGSTE
jgi:hypothetical protein